MVRNSYPPDNSSLSHVSVSISDRFAVFCPGKGSHMFAGICVGVQMLPFCVAVIVVGIPALVNDGRPGFIVTFVTRCVVLDKLITGCFA